MIRTALLLAGVLVPSAASAEARWTASVGSAGRAPTTSSATRLVDGGLAGIAVGAERVVTTRAIGGREVELGAMIGYAYLGGGGTWFGGAVTTAASLHQTTLGARARTRLRGDWLAATAGVDVGVAAVGADVESGGLVIADRGAAPLASAQLGIAVQGRIGARGGVRVSLGVAGGYTALGAVGLDASPVRDADLLTLPTMAAALGDLDLGGWDLRSTLSVAF